MSDEEKKNEKPQPCFKVRECGDRTGVFLNGVTSVEDPDERCKDIGENEIEIEVAYRFSRRDARRRYGGSCGRVRQFRRTSRRSGGVSGIKEKER